jgi:hypothetical protein
LVRFFLNFFSFLNNTDPRNSFIYYYF